MLQASEAASINYLAGFKNASFLVGPKSPVVAWPVPSAIAAGTALSGTQLDATASVPGTFIYTPKLGTVLGVGANQTLSVTFMPTDIISYSSATASVQITVTTPPPTSTVSLGISSGSRPTSSTRTS